MAEIYSDMCAAVKQNKNMHTHKATNQTLFQINEQRKCARAYRAKVALGAAEREQRAEEEDRVQHRERRVDDDDDAKFMEDLDLAEQQEVRGAGRRERAAQHARALLRLARFVWYRSF
jgi:hypothetical protein